jgi:hypothetical protein
LQQGRGKINTVSPRSCNHFYQISHLGVVW